MKNTKITISLLVIVLTLAYSAIPLFASSKEKEYAEKLGQTLNAIFTPDDIKVTINGKYAWIETVGAKIDHIRIEKIIFKAKLKDELDKLLQDKPEDAIEFAEGELILLEKDVNNYFIKEDVKDFKDLSFDFTKDGFKGKGAYMGDFTLGLKVNIGTTGNLALEKDGIYFRNTDLYIVNVKQPREISSLIINKINPLLNFKDIPFPVKFKELKMTEEAIILTSFPQKIVNGATWQK
ncbi:MAG: hypothetical protein RR272_00125 [Synergistaceae bacterium]